MKIEKKLIKELVDNLKEFDLTELEYQEGQTKIKVSKISKGIEQIKTSAVVPQNKAVLKSSDIPMDNSLRKTPWLCSSISFNSANFLKQSLATVISSGA